MAGVCWNGSPFQAVPVATDVAQEVALRVLEQPEDYPGVLAEQQNVRAYPSPHGVNMAHLLGYLSPITEEEYDRASADDDLSLNGASVVGRAGVEKEYDAWLRGMPGYKRVAVDSMGRVVGDDGEIASTPGDTLVTSLDSKVQGVVERELARSIATQRTIRDSVTGRNYAADSGAAVVMEADTGRIVAMASQPTYDPDVWVGGISQSELSRLYSEKAGTPLLSRATQGQFAPGSTWKPFMTAAALSNGYSTGHPARAPRASRSATGCSRTTSRVPTATSGSPRRSRSPATPSSTGSASTTGSGSAPTWPTSTPSTRWWRGPSSSASAPRQAWTCPARRPAGSRTGPGSAPTTSRRRTTTAGSRTPRRTPRPRDFVYKFAREFCIEGYAYRAGDAVNFSIGQGDTIVTPLQLARAYASLANGGTLWEPRVGKAIVSPEGTVLRRIPPKKQGSLKASKQTLAYIDNALQGVARQGTMGWKLIGFPLDEVKIRAKTGSAEVYGKQTTGWVASYTEDYVVVMMISQGGTGSGSTGDSIRAIWESLYGVEGDEVVPAKAAIPGTVPPQRLPSFQPDGTILPPGREGK